eukprot:1148407-Pelagomonas_calceolata.AAC.2
MGQVWVKAFVLASIVQTMAKVGLKCLEIRPWIASRVLTSLGYARVPSRFVATVHTVQTLNHRVTGQECSPASPAPCQSSPLRSSFSASCPQVSHQSSPHHAAAAAAAAAAAVIKSEEWGMVGGRGCGGHCGSNEHDY